MRLRLKTWRATLAAGIWVVLGGLGSLAWSADREEVCFWNETLQPLVVYPPAPAKPLEIIPGCNGRLPVPAEAGLVTVQVVGAHTGETLSLTCPFQPGVRSDAKACPSRVGDLEYPGLGLSAVRWDDDQGRSCTWRIRSSRSARKVERSSAAIWEDFLTSCSSAGPTEPHRHTWARGLSAAEAAEVWLRQARDPEQPWTQAAQAVLKESTRQRQTHPQQAAPRAKALELSCQRMLPQAQKLAGKGGLEGGHGAGATAPAAAARPALSAAQAAWSAEHPISHGDWPVIQAQPPAGAAMVDDDPDGYGSEGEAEEEPLTIMPLSLDTLSYLGERQVLRICLPLEESEDDFHYQWYQDGVLLDGETDLFLDLPSVSERDRGTYQVLVKHKLTGESWKTSYQLEPRQRPAAERSGPSLGQATAQAGTASGPPHR